MIVAFLSTTWRMLCARIWGEHPNVIGTVEELQSLSGCAREPALAKVTADPDILQSFEMDGKHPRTVTIVEIVEVYFQCARAVMRAGLWDQGAHVDQAFLPTPGHMLKSAIGQFDQATCDREWPERASRSLW